MGYPTKVQLIQRKASSQWYINFLTAIAQGMDFSKGEDVEWTITDKGNLILSRKKVPSNPIDLKKLYPPSTSRRVNRSMLGRIHLSGGSGAGSPSYSFSPSILWPPHHHRLVALPIAFEPGLSTWLERSAFMLCERAWIRMARSRAGW